MTKQEFKTEYSFARAMLAHARKQPNPEAAWDRAWHRLRTSYPQAIYRVVLARDPIRRLTSPWPPTAAWAISLNLKYVRNSYPHYGRSV